MNNTRMDRAFPTSQQGPKWPQSRQILRCSSLHALKPWPEFHLTFLAFVYTLDNKPLNDRL